MFDVVIEGRMVVDGTEAPAWRVDVDVKGDQIADCCDLVQSEARRVLNASGLIVAPVV